MKGIIITNGYTHTEGVAYQVNRLTEEFSRLGVNVEAVKNNELTAFIQNNDIKSRLDCDFIVYLDKDIHIAMMLEKAGYRLFNSRESIEICDDKIKTHIVLSGEGIAMPDTISSPLMYNKSEDNFVEKVVEKLSFPIVVKEAHGSLGGQVYLCNDIEELQNIRKKLVYVPHLYQQFIDKSKGRDCRVIVVGGKVVAGYLRISKGDFRSNIELGGRGEKFDLPNSFIDLAESVADILHLDYCGIDLLINGDKPILCEVNSNAFFGGAEKYTDKNIARVYAEYIVDKVTTNK